MESAAIGASETRFSAAVAGALRLLWAAVTGLPAAAPPARAAEKRAQQNLQAEEILDDYGNSILRLAYSYLHNASDAEEILQDTLIQFLRAAPPFENETHKKAWLLRVAGNLSKNRIAYNRVRSADELNEELLAEDREDLSFVWEAVKALPVKYREVIHLFYQEGYQTAEIASLLQENEATVRSHLNRGRAKLREILKEAYDFA
jgi:RNA polymerase sigma factor (sigma-70 family)